MKGCILIIVLLCLFSSQAKTQQTDTVFLYRFTCDTPYSFYHAIFIDTSRNSDFRRSVTEFSIDKYGKETYESDLVGLRPLRKNLLPKDLPLRWVLLYLYHGEYFTYHPSEAGWAFKFALNDSITIDYSMEGPTPARIKAIRKVGENQFTIDREHPWLKQRVNITLIDAAKGIAVFQFVQQSQKQADIQLLMVDADKAFQFSTIVNFCVTDKQAEFEFDPIDFDVLLKKH